MKPFWYLLVASILTAAIIGACVPGLNLLKQSSGPDRVSDQKKAPDAPKPIASGKGPSAGLKDTVPADLALPTSGQSAGAGDIFGLRAQVNQAALEFVAANFRNVKAVKTCYSRLDGGWSLFVYVSHGKKTLLSQYTWNIKAKEWEPVPVLANKEIPADQLESHINGEVNDEKCFQLKK
jgi:hypothetical protein